MNNSTGGLTPRRSPSNEQQHRRAYAAPLAIH
jgi:hypothetical protein